MVSNLSPHQPYIFDLHNNGATLPPLPERPAKIVAFNDPNLTLEDIRSVLTHIKSLGTSILLPTIMTTDPKVLFRNVALIAEAMEQPWGDTIGGIHLEGPFINRVTKGAHPLQHVREKPDVGLLATAFEAAKGRIALITLSPQLQGALPFIEKIRNLGIEVSLGHHTASPSQIEEAISAGARGITHLGNAGLKPLRGKGEDLLAQIIAGSDTYVMLIPDGVHVSTHYLKYVSTLVEALRPGHTVWVSDSSPLATAPLGTTWNYDGQISTVVIDSGDRIRPEPLSGSYLLLPECLDTLRTMGAFPERLITDGASKNPLQFMKSTMQRIHELAC